MLPLIPTIYLSNESAVKTSVREPQKREAIARLLARRAILLNSEGRHPLYQLSKHYTETLELYRRVREEVDFVTRTNVSFIEKRQRYEVDTALVLLRAALHAPGSVEQIQSNLGVFLNGACAERRSPNAFRGWHVGWWENDMP